MSNKWKKTFLYHFRHFLDELSVLNHLRYDLTFGSRAALYDTTCGKALH